MHRAERERAAMAMASGRKRRRAEAVSSDDACAEVSRTVSDYALCLLTRMRWLRRLLAPLGLCPHSWARAVADASHVRAPLAGAPRAAQTRAARVLALRSHVLFFERTCNAHADAHG